jgi:tungstate transport system substrate-binding protein
VLGGAPRRIATVRQIDGRDAGRVWARRVSSASVAALVLAGCFAAPHRIDGDAVGQGAERLQDPDERERDQASQHEINVLPRRDPSSDRARRRRALDRAAPACYLSAAMLRGLLTALLLTALPVSAHAQRSPVILSTTTSTQDSGLLDVLVPLFEQKTGYTVKTIAVGTGQALALAARGEADVVLAHAPALEKKYVADGKMLDRRLVMYNDFVIIGPADDPAKIKGLTKAADAMKAIAATGSRFVSRGDNSGTHVLEKSLWKLAGVEPQGAWYIEAGQGMGATLGIADDRKAYTLTDRGTFLLEGDRPLLNIYSVMRVNPSNGPRVNTAGGAAFADFMLSADVQQVIKTFGVDKYGQPLFVPVAGANEEDVGRKP